MRGRTNIDAIDTRANRRRKFRRICNKLKVGCRIFSLSLIRHTNPLFCPYAFYQPGSDIHPRHINYSIFKIIAARICLQN
ncbi:hypothetical protein BLNAU_23363 [Blattamonas nauphoetae]|uniref:Uncharacterized protein n=1 Tax=Blattamonas nauphoetae TaxID=2049346 RepID=A0ABQ9WTJ5_9EUKA|nr:hypothetical protein BLNAU_23363 [Blattamonas nauphoetae]